jgi:hypothetical protein
MATGRARRERGVKALDGVHVDGRVRVVPMWRRRAVSAGGVRERERVVELLCRVELRMA